MFEQQVLFTQRSLTLAPTGLRVAEKRPGKQTEFTIPYEDLLPLGTARRKYVPLRLTAACLFVLFGCGKACYDYVLHGDNPGSAAWLLLILLGILCVLGAFTLKQWHWDFIITTGQGNLFFVDWGPASQRLPAVVEELRAHTIQYLRQKHLWIDLALPAEAQLERLQWLLELAVIDEATYRSARQELTGQHRPQATVIGFGRLPAH